MRLKYAEDAVNPLARVVFNIIADLADFIASKFVDNGTVDGTRTSYNCRHPRGCQD
jgi:hypothetical protein